MIDLITEQALAYWEVLYPSVPKPSKMASVLQSRNQITLFHFIPGNNYSRPVLISKIARNITDSRRLESSVALIEQLRSRLGQGVRNTIPNSIIAGRVLNLTHMLQMPVVGEIMTIPKWNIVARRKIERDITAYSSWLIDFQDGTYQGSISRNITGWADYFCKWVKIMEVDSGSEKLDGRWIEIFSNQLDKVSIPLAWRHGDVHHSNLLLRNNEISGVVDWMGIQQSAWVIADWFYFLYHYALEFLRKNSSLNREDQVLEAALFVLGMKNNWLSNLFIQKTDLFLEHHHIKPSLAQALFLVFLAELYFPKGKALLFSRTVNILLNSFKKLLDYRTL